MATTTRTPSLDEVVAKMAELGYPLTDREQEVARRRLAKRGTYLGRPDPLAGTETNAVLAVDHLYDERGGPLARNLDGPGSLEDIFGRQRVEDEAEPEDMEAEVARLREENERLKVLAGPANARIEQVTASSAGPIDTSGDETPSPAATVVAVAETGSTTPDALDDDTPKGKDTTGAKGGKS